jgi:hypothetical protein
MITSTAWSVDESVIYTSSYDRYRPIIAWNAAESKEEEKEARELAARARKAVNAAKDRRQKESKEAKVLTIVCLLPERE